MKNIIILIVILLFSLPISAQNRNSVWVFGDSAGIDFANTSSPQVISSSLDTRGSCVSIADTNGNLLFYAETKAGQTGNYTTFIYDSTHNLLLNGDSVFGNGWYHELVIIPMPNNDSLFYLFNVGVTYNYGLRYSIINIKANGGLGAVIQKNISLQSFPIVDCLTAVKHGNGRDWWLIFRRWDPFTLDPNNEYHAYLIIPSGITNYTIQNVGSGIRTNGGDIKFNNVGNEFVINTLADLIELLNFNRCTGVISLNTTIQPEPTPPPYFQITWSSAFSPNGRFLYVTTSGIDTNYLYQFDLSAGNILNSRITLDTFYLPPVSPGALKLAPDSKIYFSCAYDNGVQFNYPYKDSVYNNINMNLSVINYPDSLGTACGYAPFSFYLGNKRTYYGLPNNPDYDLPALAGSPCDTLLSIYETTHINSNANLYVYYALDWAKAFINADKLNGKNYRLRIIDVLGKEVYSENGTLNSQYFTRDLNCASFASGIYLITFETEKERMVKKMQINWR